jgi:hypothetical protein
VDDGAGDAADDGAADVGAADDDAADDDASDDGAADDGVGLGPPQAPSRSAAITRAARRDGGIAVVAMAR